MQNPSSISPKEEPITCSTSPEGNDTGSDASTSKRKKKTKSTNLSDEQKKVRTKTPYFDYFLTN